MGNISHRGNVDAFREHLVAGGRASGTVNVRISHIRRCLAFIGKPLWAVKPSDIERWLAAGEWGPAARKSARTSVRVFFAWAVREGLIESNPAAAIIPVPQVRAVPRPCPDALISDAMAVASPRVRLAIEIMATCGLQRDECARVRASDVEPVGQGWVLRVQGKGGACSGGSMSTTFSAPDRGGTRVGFSRRGEWACIRGVVGQAHIAGFAGGLDTPQDQA